MAQYVYAAGMLLKKNCRFVGRTAVHAADRTAEDSDTRLGELQKADSKYL